MKTRLINGVLWLAFILAMAASIQHLAYTFGTVERPGWAWLGWIPAVAVDTGLAALAYTIQQRRKSNRSTKILWVGVFGFAIISALANLYHALSVENVVLLAGTIVYIKAVVLSATLPIMYIFLGEIIGSDDALVVAKAEQELQRLRTKDERAQRIVEQHETNEAKRLDVEQQKILLEQQHQQQAATIEQAETIGVFCERCSNTFKNRQAYAAHGCNKNGNTHLKSIKESAIIIASKEN